MSRRVPGATVGGVETFEQLLRAWSEAEARCDAAALEALLDDDFRGDGPRGFVLDKAQWLERHRRGELAPGSSDWAAGDVWVLDDTAVAGGTLARLAPERGRGQTGATTWTAVAVRRDGRWRLVNLQLSQQLA